MIELLKTPLTQTTLYLIVSIGVAIAIFTQMTILRNNKGQYPNTVLFSLLSAFDSLWVLISIVAFFWLDFLGLAIVVPAFYVLYTCLSFLYAAHTMNDGKGIPTRPEELIFSSKYLDFAQSFSIIFFLICTILLVSLYYPVPYLSDFYPTQK